MGEYNSVFTVDLSVICGNYQRIAGACGTTVMPVLKSNAYGHGLSEVALALWDAFRVKTFAVAQVSEGVALREAGISSDILLLSGAPRHLLGAALDYGLIPTVFSQEEVAALESAAGERGLRDCAVHIKIETGLRRIGVRPGPELEAMAAALKQAGRLRLAGTYSHLISGEIMDEALADKQFSLYMHAVAQLRALGLEPGMLHFCNSGGAAWYQKGYLDAVRIGRGLYMGDPETLRGAPYFVDGRLAPEAGTWQCTVTCVNTVKKGEGIGYGHRLRAQRDMRLAILCVGYGDGLHMELAARGCPVLIGGNRARLMGACMDQSYVDVTDIPCRAGDEAVLFGASSQGFRLPSQELAAAVEDEGVLLTNGLTQRVERVWTKPM